MKPIKIQIALYWELELFSFVLTKFRPLPGFAMAEPSAIKRHQASSNYITFYQIRFSSQMFTSFHFKLDSQCLKAWHLGGCCWSPFAILVLHIQVPSPSLGRSCFEKALGGKGASVQWMHLLLAVRANHRQIIDN